MACSTCGFDATAWSRSDLRRTLEHAVVPWFAQLSEGARPDVLAALAPSAARLRELSRRSVDVEVDVEVVHEAWRLIADGGRQRAAMDDGARPAEGVVSQVSASRGGVPKLAVPSALVTIRGLVGDKQANRMHHGRPWQAVCLWSADVIDALAAQGHPLGYGSAGENITIRGIDWSGMRPGVRLLVGGALLETTPYAIPCQQNAHWFSDGQFRRIAHEVSPGTSRIYARVLVEGAVATGDPVVVEPLTIPEQRTAEQLALPADR
jgi:MOSC domain-containing protein YiiM